jgi:hypothetical protein
MMGMHEILLIKRRIGLSTNYLNEREKGTSFVVVLLGGNIFNLPGTDGKAMLCLYSSAPDLPEPFPRLG